MGRLDNEMLEACEIGDEDGHYADLPVTDIVFVGVKWLGEEGESERPMMIVDLWSASLNLPVEDAIAAGVFKELLLDLLRSEYEPPPDPCLN